MVNGWVARLARLVGRERLAVGSNWRCHKSVNGWVARLAWWGLWSSGLVGRWQKYLVDGVGRDFGWRVAVRRGKLEWIHWQTGRTGRWEREWFHWRVGWWVGRWVGWWVGWRVGWRVGWWVGGRVDGRVGWRVGGRLTWWRWRRLLAGGWNRRC